MRKFLTVFCGCLFLLCGQVSAGSGPVATVLPAPIDPGVVFTTIHTFGAAPGDAAVPTSLMYFQGSLYGTTFATVSQIGEGLVPGMGTAYRVSLAGEEQTLHQFDGTPDGANPYGKLVQLNGKLYGSTTLGGQYGYGTVFEIGPFGSERVVYSFQGGANGLQPVASLVALDGMLYGTTTYGGINNCTGGAGCGTVFELSPSGSHRVLYRFKSQADGENPSGLIELGGILYGTTAFGGKNGGYHCYSGCGIIYAIDRSGNKKTIYRFDGGGSGDEPADGLVALNGVLFGTTLYGGEECGSRGCGTVFSVTTSGSARVIHRFMKPYDGDYPSGKLIVINGALYGTTQQGGASGSGTIFELSPSGKEQLIHVFTGYEGSAPVGALVDVGGVLYGTTTLGGAYDEGTVFRLSL